MAKILLIALSAALVVVNALGRLMTSSGYMDRPTMIADLATYAVLAPALLAAIFLVARANRNLVRYLGAFCLLSGMIAILNLVSVVKGAAEPSQPKVVRSDESGVSVVVPPDWRISERKSQKQSIYVVDRLATSAVVVLSIPKSEFAGGLDQFAANFIEYQRQGKFATLSVAGPLACSIQGMRCVSYELRQQVGDSTIVQLATLVEGRSDFHQIAATTTVGLLDTERPVLAGIVSSFSEGR